MIGVEQWGNSGPLILGVHGIGSSRRDFRRLGERLAATHRVVAYDQRGHGDRAEANTSMCLNDLVTDLHEVAAQFDEKIDLLIGASWGGAVALLGGPEIAAALLLIDPLIRVRPGSFDEYPADLAPLLVNPPGPGRDAVVATAFAAAHPLDRDGKVHALAHLDLEAIHRLGRDNSVEQGGWDLRSRLTTLQIPTCILLAGEDSVTTPDDVAKAAPLVSIAYVADHGHTLHRSAFERFVATVVELTRA